MIPSFHTFINESNVQKKIKRSDLKIGDDVMTMGEHDGVNLDYQVGKIIEMKDYGYILVEFEKSFSDKFHAGNENIGKDKHCFYISFNNIVSNNKEKFLKELKNIDTEKLNKNQRLNTEYAEGDVIVGVGEYTLYGKTIKFEGEIGIVYYTNGSGSIDQKDRGLKNNKLYWVGFLDKFNQMLRCDGEGMPENGAGVMLDKLHMRPIEPEELESVIDVVEPIRAMLKDMNTPLQAGDVVVGTKEREGIKFTNQLGIVYSIRKYGIKDWYNIQFFDHFSDGLYDVNATGINNGYLLPKSCLRLANEQEIEKSKELIVKFQEEIKLYNYDYKVGDYVIAKGINNGINFNGQIGKILYINGQKPMDSFTINFITKFDDRLYSSGDQKNSYNLIRGNIDTSQKYNVEEIINKINNKEILTYITSPSLSMLMERTEVKVTVPFLLQSYFDVTDKNDTISYLPVNKFKRLESGEDPFKSRLRQSMGVGKFFRMINPEIPERAMEKIVNSYKSSYDICISGIADKLKLVSGEDIRYWYWEEHYVQGGGGLNSSCMRYKEKGPEMQMFVDNPDVIQMLILVNEENKLLGRALVWRLVQPSGATFMDYVYCRYEKDQDLFNMYALQNGWITTKTGGRYNSNVQMVCALNTDKKYTMGKNALDHFDTFQLYPGNYLSTSPWNKPVELKVKKEEKKEEVLPFTIGSKVQYKKDGTINNNKIGIFNGLNDNGKYKIQFEDGVRFAAAPKNVYPVENEKVEENKKYIKRFNDWLM